VEGAHAGDFDDSTFERVVVPHTNVRLPDGSISVTNPGS